MTRTLIISILSVLSCFAPGCTYWHQQGKSFADCERDLQHCYNELKKYADMDSIGTYEVDFVKNCMKQRGYKLILENDLPMVVRRRDPAMNTFWLLAGVSGTIEK
ncbi:MAG: hypothetical protein ACYS76_04590 [Planctomycetota bacterium]